MTQRGQLAAEQPQVGCPENMGAQVQGLPTAAPASFKPLTNIPRVSVQCCYLVTLSCFVCGPFQNGEIHSLCKMSLTASRSKPQLPYSFPAQTTDLRSQAFFSAPPGAAQEAEKSSTAPEGSNWASCGICFKMLQVLCHTSVQATASTSRLSSRQFLVLPMHEELYNHEPACPVLGPLNRTPAEVWLCVVSLSYY